MCRSSRSGVHGLERGAKREMRAAVSFRPRVRDPSARASRLGPVRSGGGPGSSKGGIVLQGWRSAGGLSQEDRQILREGRSDDDLQGSRGAVIVISAPFGISMPPNSPSSVGSSVLFTMASLAIVHALGESLGLPGILAGVTAMAGAGIWLRWRWHADSHLTPSGRSFLKRLEGKARRAGRRPPPPDDFGGPAPVASPLRPRPVLTGGAAKSIPSELR